MRTTALAMVLALGMMIGHADAQYVGIPKTFQPSLDAATKRVRLKSPPPTTAPSVKDTLYRVGDALGMLRDTDERDAILTMDWRAGGTMTVDGQSCTLANYRGQVRYSVPAMRLDFACAQPDGKPGARHVQVIAGAMAWNETARVPLDLPLAIAQSINVVAQTESVVDPPTIGWFTMARASRS